MDGCARVWNSAATNWQENEMSEQITRRRMFSLFGLATASILAVPAAVLTPSDAEAQTYGMQRRHERRVGRHDRRETRRTGRHERRNDRRAGSTSSQ
jgi:hypothetical protein